MRLPNPSPASAAATASQGPLEPIRLPPESQAMADRLGLKPPECLHLRGQVSTHDEGEDLIGMIVVVQQANGWCFVDRETGEYWEVGEPLASEMRERHVAAQARYDSMSAEEVAEVRRLNAEFVRPENMERMVREAREQVERDRADPAAARARREERRREWEAKGRCGGACS